MYEPLIPEHTETQLGIRHGHPCILCASEPTTTMAIETQSGFSIKNLELKTVQRILKEAPCCEQCRKKYQSSNNLWGYAMGSAAFLAGIACFYFTVRFYWADNTVSIFGKILASIIGGIFFSLFAAAFGAAFIIFLKIIYKYPQRLRIRWWMRKWCC